MKQIAYTRYRTSQMKTVSLLPRLGLSVGIENSADLIDDHEQAINMEIFIGIFNKRLGANFV
jgi:O-acetylhomoserine/O-acetylserine sulfhydrylase-like pyridoxal-dependent enzyme